MRGLEPPRVRPHQTRGAVIPKEGVRCGGGRGAPPRVRAPLPPGSLRRGWHGRPPPKLIRRPERQRPARAGRRPSWQPLCVFGAVYRHRESSLPPDVALGPSRRSPGQGASPGHVRLTEGDPPLTAAAPSFGYRTGLPQTRPLYSLGAARAAERRRRVGACAGE
jgi:hypothetical protein